MPKTSDFSTFSGSADSQTVKVAYLKVMRGEELTKTEQATLKRHERVKEERLRAKYYASIPQKDWARMSGRQAKVLNEQAARYGIPVGGPTIDLNKVARAIHDFFAANAGKLSREDEELMQGPASPALEAYREERAKIAKIQREQLQRQLVPREEVRQHLARIAMILRSAGDTLQRSFGAEAVEILYEALEDAEREIEHAFGDGREDTSVDQPQRADSEAESDGAD